MAVSNWIAGAGLALLTATAAVAGAPAFPTHATGDWEGTIQAKGAPKHLFVSIHWHFHGDYVATLVSPEQKIGAVVVRPVAAPDGVLAFTADGGHFRGQWSQANGRWEGTWTEEGVSSPLILSLNDDPAAQHTILLLGLQNLADQPQPQLRSAPPDIVPPSAR